MIRPTIFVFAKPARRGRAKTRLAKGIGDAVALSFQRACLAMTLRKLQRGPWRLVLCATPDASARNAHLWPLRILRAGQGRGDLGARMERALMSRRGPAIVVGSDIPDLSAARVREAFKKLGNADLVFGKSRDGGYWLVGSRHGALAKGAFRNARWSSEHALADTLANVKHRRVAFAATLDDVDDADDYARWIRRSPSASS
ncbi:MAG: TIGR04282 family arsenosugar biosynthesis glycosyltransferase [Alphaproteobacteria bacterium]|nr:TIGR04282 family arsenosugar biosynthesis glycosyltransferase [Alphaproteobacteria bacterium]MCA0449888.1 TIGR04282 family arsenosugar biosynthesis glycosyltransferase [Pseudomonadota bacterium]